MHSQTAFQEPVRVTLADLDRDPHGIFRRLRPLSPLLRREDDSYIAIRAEHVLQLITDPRTRQLETELPRSRGLTQGPLLEFFTNSMLFSNGRDHRRRRAPVSRAFAARLIDALRPRIRAVADELIDEAYARGAVDFVADFCAPLPARMISEILGLPPADVPRFTSWVYSMSRAISSSFQRADAPAIEAATHELTAYVAALLAARRADPKDDFLTTYAAAVSEQGDLAAAEMIMQIVTVIVGGSDTTRAAMAALVALLQQHREQWDAVCREAAFVPGAVAEALRFDPPVASIPRFTLEDIELDGQLVPRHRLLSVSTLAAMRDPALYADPDRFDIRRTDHPARHLVFGGGAHRCLGEALARAELEEGLMALTARLPKLQLASEPAQLLGHSGIRRVTEMRLTWK
jgi:cytochrome P450